MSRPNVSQYVKNRSALLLVLLSTLIISCNSKAPSEQKRKKRAGMTLGITSKVLTTNTDTSAKAAYDPWNSKDPRNFEACGLFARADSSSEMIRTLPLATLLKIQDGVDDAGKSGRWYKVSTGDGLMGYVPMDKVARQTLTDEENHLMYFLVSGSRQYYNEDVVLLRCDLQTKNIKSYPANVSSEAFTSIEFTRPGELKGLLKLVVIKSSGEACGIPSSTTLVGETGDKLVLFPRSFSSGDDGGGIDFTNAFFPVRNGKNQLVLALDSKVKPASTPANEWTIPYPTNTKISKNELIVVEGEEGQYAMDDDNNAIMENGEPKLEALTKTTIYYRWDGKTLKEVQQQKVKIK